MTPDELTDALDQLSPVRVADQTRLAGEVRRELKALPARAVEVAGSPDAEVSLKGRALVAALEEAAVDALLDGAVSQSVSQEVWRMHTAAAAAIGLRARVAAYLISQLGDRRFVPFPRGYEGLARPPESRVCDEAYIALRELANTGESRGAFTLDRRVFLRLTETEKDREIAAAVAGLPYTRFVEDAQV